METQNNEKTNNKLSDSSKHETKNETKSETKSETKNETKNKTKSETKSESKNDLKNSSSKHNHTEHKHNEKSEKSETKNDKNDKNINQENTKQDVKNSDKKQNFIKIEKSEKSVEPEIHVTLETVCPTKTNYWSRFVTVMVYLILFMIVTYLTIMYLERQWNELFPELFGCRTINKSQCYAILCMITMVIGYINLTSGTQLYDCVSTFTELHI